MRVLALINEVSPLSNSFETSVWIAEETDAEVVIASFFDSDQTDFEIDTNRIAAKIIPLGANSRFDLDAWLSFRELVNSGQFDIIHTHQNFSGAIARVISTIDRVPVVNTEHRNHESFSILQTAVNAPTLWLGDRVVANSKSTLASFKWYENFLLNDEQARVVYNGVDLDQIDAARSGSNRTNQGFTIICVGRLVPVKNHSTLLRGFANVLEAGANAELLLVGDGSCKDDLLSLSRELSISEHVEFTGSLPRDRVYKLLWDSDLFVITSKSEGFGVAAVEAMATELPVIASDIDTFHEVLGDAGIFVNENDPIHIGHKINELLADTERRQQLAKRGRIRAKEKFDRTTTARNYYRIYQELV